MSEDTNDILKLPVYYNSAYFAINGTDNQTILRLQIPDLPISKQIIVGDFIATAINSYPDNQWISVKDRLPEKGERVETYSPNMDYPHRLLTWNHSYDEVTHWRGLSVPEGK